MSIKQLPDDVIAQVKSSAVITSLSGVVLGLLRNSLDANATKIHISVDFRLGHCTVEDNGLGIPPSEFGEGGGLGRLHFTSKFPLALNVYGRAGVFLYSVAALSLLSVTSHHHLHISHNSLALHNSAVVSRHTPARPEHRILTFPHGTRVTVRDLFGLMPVRVKQRALEIARSSTLLRDWDQLVRMVVSLLLAFPDEAAVSLRDLSSSSSQNLTLRSGDGGGTIAKTIRLLSRASLWDCVDSKSWVPIGASSAGISIEGCVSLVPAATKRLQFISIGIEPLPDEHRANVLFEEINKVFANSRFGFIEGDGDEADIARDYTTRELKVRKGLDRWPVFYLRISLDARPGQTAAMAPEDVMDENHANLGLIVDLLRAMAYSFLKRHYFSPHKVHVESSRSQSKVSRSIPVQSETVHASPLADKGLNRLTCTTSPIFKDQISCSYDLDALSPDGPRYLSVGVRASTLNSTTKPLADSQRLNLQSGVATRNATAYNDRLIDFSGKLRRRPFPDADIITPSRPASWSTADAASGLDTGNSLPERETFTWVDPASGTKHLLDARTGNPIKPRPSTEKPTAEPKPWLKDLLARWKNPVFELTESAIPQLPDAAERLAGRHSHDGCHATLELGAGQQDAPSLALDGRLSKSSLRQAEVIAQVDQKFILAKVPLTAVRGENGAGTNRRDEELNNSPPVAAVSRALVLIDQHAADERCRVEELMRDYFVRRCDAGGGGGTSSSLLWTANVELLDTATALRFELSSRDCTLLDRCRPHFERWGIVYDVSATAEMSKTAALAAGKMSNVTQSGGGRGRVRVNGLPPAIAERCRSEPNLMVELLRREAWKLESEPLPPPPALSAAPESGLRTGEDPWSGWVSRFHGCPQGILDLINSRACRSAIMFNDPLSVDDCAALLRRLSGCTFPFQCAHGRPSMVPLLDLGTGMGEIDVCSEDMLLNGGGFLSQLGEQGRAKH